MKKALVALVALVLLWPGLGWTVVEASELLPNAQQVFFGPNGTPLAAGFVFTYVPGTTTAKTTWQNQALTVPNSNPIVLDSSGMARIWVASNQSYRQVVLDSNSSLIWDQITTSPGDLAGLACTTGHVTVWGTSGTSLVCDPAVSVVDNSLDVQTNDGPQLSSVNNLYFPSYSQLAGSRFKMALTGPVSDSTGSFRDTLYVELTNSDTTLTYTNQHSNYAIRAAVFGPNTAGVWQNGMQNYQALSAYCQAANSAMPNPTFPTGCGALSADSVQWGAGIGDNEFRAANPSAADGAIAQSTSLVPVQAIVEANFADVDATHRAYGVMVTNISTKLIDSFYTVTSNPTATARSMIQTNGALVTEGAIIMPGSGTVDAGTIIDYGRWNGNPVGGSFTKWSTAVDGGTYSWTDAGNHIMSVGVSGLRLLSTGDLITQPALATTAVGPFVHLTGMAGTPTGIPTLATTGSVPCLFDTTANKIWCFANAAWRGVAVAP